LPDNYPGQASLDDVGSDFANHQFLIKQMLGRLWTATLVMVQSVTNAGGVSAVGSVSVQPLVAAVDVEGTVQAHGTIYNVPYFRAQGGANAVIIDPVIGDIGICVFASRDISAVKASKAASAPGSFRRFDPADGLYLGGFLNGVPSQYVRFFSGGIQIVSPTQITLQAPTIALVGNVTASATVIATGEVTGNGVPLSTHVHSGVQTGSGDTGPPT
jgi:hypothetical protein